MLGQDWRLDLAEGRTPAAECQWWADLLSSSQTEWGSAGAPRLFYPPEAEVQWGDVSVMGRCKTVEKLSLQEDSRTSFEGGLSRAGISPRATMLQEVDQPCGSGAHGAAERLCSFRPLPPPPPLWHWVSTTLRRQPAAGAGAGVEAQAEAGREGESRRWPAR